MHLGRDRLRSIGIWCARDLQSCLWCIMGGVFIDLVVWCKLLVDLCGVIEGEITHTRLYACPVSVENVCGLPELLI